jgi:predicted acylesterase/phospholipase RssA
MGKLILRLGFAWAVSATLWPGGSWADAEELTHSDPPTRPRICLVLSGGGARGMAHIGVLMVLEDLKIPIDCIAGTSMGAIVGGLYASGMTARQIDATMRSVDWQEALRSGASKTTEIFSFGCRSASNTERSCFPKASSKGRNCRKPCAS